MLYNRKKQDGHIFHAGKDAGNPDGIGRVKSMLGLMAKENR
jgi:hypothetical protein